MKGLKSDISLFIQSLHDFMPTVENHDKYPFNRFYSKKYQSKFKDIKVASVRLFSKFYYIENKNVKEAVEKFIELFKEFISTEDIEEKTNRLDSIDVFFPLLELELDRLNEVTSTTAINIPEDIKDSEEKKDLNEAIISLNAGCYHAALVIARKAYENALVAAYEKIKNEKPYDEFVCDQCGKHFGKRPIGIVKLHRWAIENDLIPDKLQHVGFLVPDLGAGGGHASLTSLPFHRDKQIAKLGIDAAIILVKQIHSKI